MNWPLLFITINLIVSPVAGKQNTLANALRRINESTFEDSFCTMSLHLSLQEVFVKDHVFNFGANYLFFIDFYCY